MDSFCGYNTCTANSASNDSFIITHEAIAEYLHHQELLTHITCLQISTWYKYLSICFKDRYHGNLL